MFPARFVSFCSLPFVEGLGGGLSPAPLSRSPTSRAGTRRSGATSSSFQAIEADLRGPSIRRLSAGGRHLSGWGIVRPINDIRLTEGTTRGLRGREEGPSRPATVCLA